MKTIAILILSALSVFGQAPSVADGTHAVVLSGTNAAIVYLDAKQLHGTGAPTLTCSATVNLGHIYTRDDAGAINASLYACNKTGASTYSWEGPYLSTASGSGSNEQSHWYFQGVYQAGGNLNFSQPTSLSCAAQYATGSTTPMASASFASGQSTQHCYVSFMLPSGYTANQALNFVLESSCDSAGTCDTTHAPIMSFRISAPGAGAVPFDVTYTAQTTPVTLLTNLAAGATRYTTGVLTPNANGLPATSSGRQRIFIDLMPTLTTLTGAFLVQSIQFYL